MHVLNDIDSCNLIVEARIVRFAHVKNAMNWVTRLGADVLGKVLWGCRDVDAGSQSDLRRSFTMNYIYLQTAIELLSMVKSVELVRMDGFDI